MLSDTCNKTKIIQNIKTPDSQYVKNDLDTLQWDDYDIIDDITGNLICSMNNDVAFQWSWKAPFKNDVYKKIHKTFSSKYNEIRHENIIDNQTICSFKTDWNGRYTESNPRMYYILSLNKTDDIITVTWGPNIIGTNKE